MSRIVLLSLGLLVFGLGACDPCSTGTAPVRVDKSAYYQAYVKNAGGSAVVEGVALTAGGFPLSLAELGALPCPAPIDACRFQSTRDEGTVDLRGYCTAGPVSPDPSSCEYVAHGSNC